MQKHSAAIIGGGPAGLMAAETLAAAGVAVTVFDHMPSVGRKLLMAGRGGLNLTHAEPLPNFLARYGAAQDWLAPFIAAFPPEALIAWCQGLGQATFTGTSRRVFPVAMKASPLLRAWLRRLDTLGVQVRTRHRWTGWNGDALCFNAPDLVRVRPDVTVLALGGASWPRLGSDGGWSALLPDIAPLRPSNCGFRVEWSPLFRDRFAGRPLKRIALTFQDVTLRGEAVLTGSGLEGGAVYALSARLRDAIEAEGFATLLVDLRPDLDHERLHSLLSEPRRGQSLSNVLRKRAGLSVEAAGLVQEALHTGADGGNLSALIKAFPLRLTGVMPIERAISSTGGVRRDAVDKHLMLHARPGTFVAGEMLDWEAPTGGYLLQACFATGAAAGQGALHWLRDDGHSTVRQQG